MCRPLTGLVCILLLLFSCKSADLYFSHPYKKITTLPGPEDMVLDTIGNEPRIIIGCASRRKSENFVAGIQWYQVNSGEVNTFSIKNFPDTILFNPHGIDIGTYQEKKILWVINHEEKNQQTFHHQVDHRKRNLGI